MLFIILSVQGEEEQKNRQQLSLQGKKGETVESVAFTL